MAKAKSAKSKEVLSETLPQEPAASEPVSETVPPVETVPTVEALDAALAPLNEATPPPVDEPAEIPVLEEGESLPDPTENTSLTLEEALLGAIGDEPTLLNDLLAMFVDQDSRADNKRLRTVLENLYATGQIEVEGTAHRLLDTVYYSGNDPRTRYHNLKSVAIWARKK